MKLSEHFTLGEFTKTKHQTADGNVPSHVVIENLKRICDYWLEDLRYSYNTLYCLQPGEDYETSKNVEPIIINSGYRSPAVNLLAGGSKTSNHLSAITWYCSRFSSEGAFRTNISPADLYLPWRISWTFTPTLSRRSLRKSIWLETPTSVGFPP